MFNDFVNNPEDWNVKVATPDDKWREVCDCYSENKRQARDFAVRLLREEYNFITVSDNEQIYCYDSVTGIYQNNARQVMKQRL